MLIVDKENCFAQDQYGQMILNRPPNFTFSYMEIKYWDRDKERLVNLEGEIIHAAIEQDQRAEIEAFIDAERARRGVSFAAIDADGRYLGVVNEKDPRIKRKAFLPPPNADDWVMPEGCDNWVRAYGYDDAGVITRINDPKAVGFTTKEQPKINGVIACQWDNEAKDWKLPEMPDEKWVEFIKREMLLGVSETLIRGFKATIEKNFDEQSAYEYLKGLMEVVNNYGSNWLVSKSDNADTSAVITGIKDALNELLIKLQGVDAIASQEAYGDFKSKVYLASGMKEPVEDLKGLDISDMIVDQYVSKG